mmetsp:Transcript_5214/g.13170  ORF Transcript_5214/g.13170 Transcript_5214/m.13170 type:complete len:194 (+) Transcript_5214:280-861(+)|eukprot:jgi/Tetstr1/441186/TSEL_029443.t1
MQAESAVCCPGDRLERQDKFACGEGTYVHEGYIVASTIGVREVRDAAEAMDDKRPVLCVVRKQGQQSIVPAPGDTVTVKVTKIAQRLARADILCVGSKPTREKFPGIIRVQDVRATEIDKVVTSNCFRPGDIVRAEVISLGDSRSYYLSTAKNELGVVYAKSLAGAPMVPISWQEMQCTKTNATEPRKVAKAT